MTPLPSARINEQRFWSTEASSKIGTIPATAEHGAGLSRLTLTDADKTMRDLASQAGHDAYFMARVCPTAMIFTPCREGITRHPNEFTTIKETAPGVNVLLHTVISPANRSDRSELTAQRS